jgi:hypothetical protein
VLGVVIGFVVEGRNRREVLVKVENFLTTSATFRL